MNEGQGIEISQAQAFLASHFDTEPAAVAYIGEGAWSRCFGFRLADRDLVVRFGKYVDDFYNDQRAYAYVTPALPIPEVLEIGNAFDGYFAISTRAHGIPLEDLSPGQWSAIVPDLVSALEAMRTADLSGTEGYGGWGLEGKAPHAGWSNHLLAVGEDTPDRRTYGWRERLARCPQGEATFAWGFDLLKTVADDAVPRCLLHCDLINRNVLVDQDRISGIFDWGCSLYGDHLYDLAWFEFWAPWHSNLDIQALRTNLEQRWREVGYVPANVKARLMAYHLHIGLDHLAYNAYREDCAAVLATAERMRALVTGP